MKIEEVEYELDWSTFYKGKSVFIPCLDYVRAKRIIHSEAKKHKQTVLVKGVIENGMRGLRMWRL